MAVYTTSDLHGYPLEQFLALLKKADFGEEDYLYVLGDVIDRNGDGGISLLRWMIRQPNVELLLGNHEDMMISCFWAFEQATTQTVNAFSCDRLRAFRLWELNGGTPTIRAYKELVLNDPKEALLIAQYLVDAKLCEGVEVGDRAFLLCHAGFGNFSPRKKLSDYKKNDLLWSRPTKSTQYFPDVMTVIGHTPTRYYGDENRAYRTKTWIDIDTGAGHGRHPMLLRLDDMQEFYVR